MCDCQACRRPSGRGWTVCGWCGVRQVAKHPKRDSFARAASVMLLVEAVLLVLATFALAAVWATNGWSSERGQALGLIWLGVMVVVGFLGWVSVNVGRTTEEPTLSGLHGRGIF
jgi:hypothetical protein